MTAGPTREAIDPVRYLSNDSSGRMGYALAHEAQKQGAKVVLISGPTSLKPPRYVFFVPVQSADQMLQASLTHGLIADIFIGAAAVADWKPVHCSTAKLKKSKCQKNSLTLKLKPNPDILLTISQKKKGPLPLVAGFALETENLIQNARLKMQSKNLDLIVANKPAALNKQNTSAWVIPRFGAMCAFKHVSKEVLAGKILGAIRDLRESNRK